MHGPLFLQIDGTELSNSEQYNDMFDLSKLPCSDGEDADGKFNEVHAVHCPGAEVPETCR